MLSKRQKKEIVNALTKDLQESKAVVFSDFKGLPTAEIQELRAQLREAGVDHKVVKINLLKLALQRAGIDVANFDFSVPLAVSLGYDDEVAPAKIVNNFGKNHENLKILGGILDDRLIDIAQVKHLAGLPGKDELRGQIVGLIASPLRGLAMVLSGNIRGLMNVLNAKANKS